MLQFTVLSFLWLLFSLLLGLGYAFLLYRGKNSFYGQVKKLLFILRTVLVSLICFLLLAPFIRQSKKIVQKPVIIFAQDNSLSVATSEPKGFNLHSYIREVQKLQKDLSSEYDLKTFTVGDGIREGNSYKFDEKITDLNSLFRHIDNRYANQNIGALILATDGIYNRGGDPLYAAGSLKCPIFTVALGDTVPKKDLLIPNVHYNTLVYSGNDFEIGVDVEAYQAKGNTSSLVISGGDNVLFRKNIYINSNEYHQSISAVLPAGKKGIHRFTAKLIPLQGELSSQNNQAEFFVEVLDGKQKVLILAASPHPDIAALKQGLEANKNYEVKTRFADNVRNEDLENADLIILHQLPSVSVPLRGLLPRIRDKSLLFILGAQSNLADFSAMQNVLAIQAGATPQEVTAKSNDNFYTFSFEDSLSRQLPVFGALLSPSGSYRLKSVTSVLLYQQIGSVVTNRPLLLFSALGEQKTGILAGEGFWRWRMNDFKQNGNHELTDGLLRKIALYLSGKDDKRKFRVYPARNSFDENEHVILNAELYNDANELVNAPDVTVIVKGRGKRAFPFIFSRSNNAYILDAGVLPYGEYSFIATTQHGAKKYKAEGRFAVVRQTVELKQTIANHQFLNVLAGQSGGKMISPSRIRELNTLLANHELIKDISFEDRKFEEMISLKWIFFLIIALLSAEWFLRKRSGDF